MPKRKPARKSPAPSRSRILKRVARQVKKKRRPSKRADTYQKADFAKRGLYLKGSYSKLVPQKRKRKKRAKAKKQR